MTLQGPYILLAGFVMCVHLVHSIRRCSSKLCLPGQDRVRDAKRRLASHNPLLLTTNLSDLLFGNVLGVLQALAHAARFLAPPTPRDVFLTTLAKTTLPPPVVATLDEPPQAQPLVQAPRRPIAQGPWLSSGPVPQSPSGSVRSSSSGLVPSSPHPALWSGRLVVLWPHPLVTQFRPLARPLIVLWLRPLLLWHGNKQRVLWKTTCTSTTLNSHLSFAECTLYVALAPSVQTSAMLKSTCHTWEDALWTTISVWCKEWRQARA
jgi:hypothetical protein